MSVHLPAGMTIGVQSAPQRYIVRNQLNSSDFYFDIATDLGVRAGQHLCFYNADMVLLGKGYVLQVDSEQALGRSFALLTEVPRFCELVKAWKIKQAQTELLVNNFFQPHSAAAELFAVCQVPTDYVPGRIRWSLFHRADSQSDYVEVIQGNDLDLGGICQYNHSASQWPIGEYLLVAQRYSAYGNLTKQATNKWLLISPSNNLSCGGYTDPLAKLYL